ncbi:MAG TPA: hypothetical protein VIP05_33600, partial [Burkholderiaceae bacterium]
MKHEGGRPATGGRFFYLLTRLVTSGPPARLRPCRAHRTIPPDRGSKKPRHERVAAEKARTMMNKDGRMIQNTARTHANAMATLSVLFA